MLVLFVGLVLGRWDFPLLLAAAPLKHAQDGAHAVMSVAHFPLLLAAAPLKLLGTQYFCPGARIFRCF